MTMPHMCEYLFTLYVYLFWNKQQAENTQRHPSSQRAWWSHIMLLGVICAAWCISLSIALITANLLRGSLSMLSIPSSESVTCYQLFCSCNMGCWLSVVLSLVYFSPAFSSPVSPTTVCNPVEARSSESHIGHLSRLCLPPLSAGIRRFLGFNVGCFFSFQTINFLSTFGVGSSGASGGLDCTGWASWSHLNCLVIFPPLLLLEPRPQLGRHTVCYEGPISMGVTNRDWILVGWTVPLTYLMQHAVVVVSCCLSSRRSGRGEKVEGGVGGNEMKNLPLFLRCIEPVPPRPVIRLHSASSWVGFTLQPWLIQAGCSTAAFYYVPFEHQDSRFQPFSQIDNKQNALGFNERESDKLDLTEMTHSQGPELWRHGRPLLPPSLTHISLHYCVPMTDFCLSLLHWGANCLSACWLVSRTMPAVLLGCFLILYVPLRATKICLTKALFGMLAFFHKIIEQATPFFCLGWSVHRDSSSCLL